MQSGLQTFGIRNGVNERERERESEKERKKERNAEQNMIYFIWMQKLATSKDVILLSQLAEFSFYTNEIYLHDLRLIKMQISLRGTCRKFKFRLEMLTFAIY